MNSVWRDPVILALSLSQLVVSAGLYYLFPALVLHWQQDFGWSLPQIMGAFSTALIVQGLTAKPVGRRLDRGLGPWLMAGGGVLAALGLVALTLIENLGAFYLIWAVLGLTMGLTLYDAVFALLIRARGADATNPIAFVTLVAGLASSVAFVAAGSVGETWGWRVAVWILAGAILVVHVPIVLIATLKLARETGGHAEYATAGDIPESRPGYWSLTIAITLSALGLGMVISHVIPLLRWTGVTPQFALIAAAMIGVAQMTGRLLVVLIGSSVKRRPLVTVCLLGLAGALFALLLAPHWAPLLIVFACLHGACYGISSGLRPVLIRDALGQGGIGASQGSVLAPAFVAFGIAPMVAATTITLVGPMILIAICIVIQVASAATLAGGFQMYQSMHES